MDKLPTKQPINRNRPLENRAKPVLKTGAVGNNPGFQSKPAVSSLSTAVTYQKQSIKKVQTGTKDRAKVVKLGAQAAINNIKRAAAAATKRAKIETLNKKQQIHAGQVHQRSVSYANASRTNPTPPANPQNAGSKSQFEEVKPKKYKKTPDLKDKQIMGLNATFGKNTTPGTDTQAVTTNPYESVRYNIPSERSDSADKPIGYDKELEPLDTKAQLRRRKAMKLVKAVVDETFGGTGGAGLGMGEKSVGDLTSAEPEKNYVLKKKKPPIKLSAFKEKLRESGFVGVPGNDASPAQDDVSIGSVGQMITVDGPAKKKPINKKTSRQYTETHNKCGTPECCGQCDTAISELSVPQGTTGKRKNTFTPLVGIRMADGTIKRLPPGKSGSSGGGGGGGSGSE
jgi:hypothetical protein